jgi:hypothetical protein
MSIRFGLKTGCDRSDIGAVSTIGTVALLQESYFQGYFITKTIFTSPLFKTYSLLLILISILLFSAPLFWSCNHSHLFPNLSILFLMARIRIVSHRTSGDFSLAHAIVHTHIALKMKQEGEAGS